MKIFIIEDEVQTAKDLKNSIERLRPDLKVTAIVDSVASALLWLKKNNSPDLIFSDIQLGDGLSFEIYKKFKITCPVIFCTAFDEYAIQAFKNNGIDYLLKPISDKDLMQSIEKVEMLRPSVSIHYDVGLLQKLLDEINGKDKKYKNAFLIPYRDKLIPIDIDDIRLFRLVNEATQIVTADNKIFSFNQSLDILEKQINPKVFYRANRQNIIAYGAIKEVEHDSERKLRLNLMLPGVDPIIISKAKASEFLKWIGNR
jgi:DNA-binding LytR/AlgR family response regulator